MLIRKQTIAAIQALGIKASFIPATFEYRVTPGGEAAAYYTQDAQDALDTARAMAAHLQVANGVIKPKAMLRYQPGEQRIDGVLVFLILDMQRNSIVDKWFSESRRNAALAELNASLAVQS